MSATDFTELGDLINRVDFDHVFAIDLDDAAVVDGPTGLYAPEVSLVAGEGADVTVDGAGGDWQCLTGMTGQDRYHGAGMHPSEYIGAGIARELHERTATAAEDGKRVYFAVVEVRDEDGDFPEGDPIGWAIAYIEV